jgi:N-acetyl-gamma-glutamyl-phosphate reductase
MTKIRAGIIGSAGYAGGELLRLLVQHPDVEVTFAHSRSQAGLKVTDLFADLSGDTELVFTDTIQDEVDVVFLCSGHGEAKKLMADYPFDSSIHIIDLSQDFRITDNETSNFVYGLPELQKDLIRQARNIANPGCFATAIQLALLPLASNKLLESDIHITATTGSTGAGQSLNETSHFSWRQNNLSIYKAFTHQHLAEIQQSIQGLQVFNYNINLIPQRGSFTRGILACVTLTCHQPIRELMDLYESYYATHPFTYVRQKNIDLKQVVNTNKCLLYLEKHDEQLMIVSVIDNLLKGASGQAVQNMNLLFGLEETQGLKLKASAF